MYDDLMVKKAVTNQTGKLCKLVQEYENQNL